MKSKPSSKSRFQRTRISGLFRYVGSDGVTRYYSHLRKGGANQWVKHGTDYGLAEKLHHSVMARGPVAVSQLVLADAHARWLANYVSTRRRPKDQKDTATRWQKHAGPILGHKLLARLTSEDIRVCATVLKGSGLAPMTQEHVLADLRCFLNWCAEAGLVERSPFPKRIMPRIEERPPDRLSDGDVEAVLGIEEPHGVVVRFLLGTGLRWGEACRAQRAHIEGDVLVISRTKSGKVRRVPLINPVADDALLRDMRGRVGKLVPFSEKSAGSFNEAVRYRSGAEAFHANMLRHTFACRYLERGGTLVALQQILGHASIVTTQRYARLSDEHVRAEARRLVLGE